MGLVVGLVRRPSRLKARSKSGFSAPISGEPCTRHQLALILEPERRCEFLAIVQCRGYPMLGRDEQIVLQQKAGEEQPMPLIVGQLLDEVLDLVSAALRLALAIAQLFGLCPQRPPQIASRLIYVPIGIRLMYRQSLLKALAI